MLRRLRELALGLAIAVWAVPAFAQAPPDVPVGTTVRVFLTDGTRRTGTLISLTPDEVHIHEHLLKLQDVRRIETVPHAARNFALAGALTGVVVAYATRTCRGSNDQGRASAGLPECNYVRPALFSGLGAVAGGIIGAAVDSSGTRVLFSAPARAPTVRAGPFVARKGAGVAVAIGW